MAGTPANVTITGRLSRAPRRAAQNQQPVPVRVVRNPRRRRRSGRQSTPDVLMPGVPNSPVAGPLSRSNIPSVNTVTAHAPMPDYTVGWLERHLDPCGEYRTALDWGKIPDGTLPQSVSGQFREVFTVRHPGADPMVAPIDGKMWSLYIVSLPLWRTAFLLVADMDRSEVGDEAMAAVFGSLNNITDASAAAYPNWLETQMSGVFWSLQSWSALRDAPSPSTLGVSPLIQDFRITGEGFTLHHNTPSLINQGIAVVAQFNPNTEHRDIGVVSEGASTELTWSYTSRIGTALGPVLQVSWKFPGVSTNTGWRGITTFSIPTSATSTNSTILPAVEEMYMFRDASGTEELAWSSGTQLRFTATLGAELVTVRLQTRESESSPWVDSTRVFSQAVVANWHMTAAGAGVLLSSESHTERYNVLTSPPVTQEDLIQQTPKTVQFLLKDTDGFYVPKRAWQPVFNMTAASSYAPIRFIDRDSSVRAISASAGVLNDTVDTNYGYAVANLTSLPLACAPYIKAIRSWEAVPARRSAWGPFTTTTTPKDENALILAKTISDLDPFAYPTDYNGFGLMFKKIVGIVSKIPRILRTGANIADAVAGVCNSVQAGVESVGGARRRQRAVARDEIVA